MVAVEEVEVEDVFEVEDVAVWGVLTEMVGALPMGISPEVGVRRELEESEVDAEEPSRAMARGAGGAR